MGVALYTAVLVAASFGHHDLVCHLKNSQHCTACTASQLGTDPTTSTVLGTLYLPDAGDAASAPPLLEGVLLPSQSTGRSPPIIF